MSSTPSILRFQPPQKFQNYAEKTIASIHQNTSVIPGNVTDDNPAAISNIQASICQASASLPGIRFGANPFWCSVQNFLNFENLLFICLQLYSVGSNTRNTRLDIQYVCILLLNWGADGCLMWRCAMIYKGGSKHTRRVCKVFILLLICLLFVVSVTVVVKDFIPASRVVNHDGKYFFIFIFTSLSINFTITSMIVLRLVYYNWSLKKYLGPNCAVSYTGIIAMMVDSAALIVVFDAAFVITTRITGQVSRESPLLIENYSMVYTLAPLSIIYRVAQARTLQPSSSKLSIPDIETLEHGQKELPAL
ncbi:hypothetical protein B0H34DRAFT_809697 [Crassisporium funariophilum]|nr:hypothetical protein B0H34DRAFT_809697 [Crassisporium funariophilum]